MYLSGTRLSSVKDVEVTDGNGGVEVVRRIVALALKSTLSPPTCTLSLPPGHLGWRTAAPSRTASAAGVDTRDAAAPV